jgi:hypothetical protein
MTRRSEMKSHNLQRAAVLLPLFLMVWLCPAQATDVTVGCAGGIGGQFSSINDALNSLDQFGPHTITVSGTCTENLVIHDRNGITIIAAAGQSATVANAANPQAIVIQYFRARRMLLDGLIVQGGSEGVLVNEDSDALIQNCTMQGSLGDGFGVQEGASATIENSIFQNNGGNGVTAGANATLTLATSPQQRIQIRNNHFAGINVDGSYLQINFGTVTIKNNGGPGIRATGGRLEIFGDNPTTTGNLYEGNHDGIDIFNGATALFFGQNIVRNNGLVGLQVDGSTADFIGGSLPDGTPDGIVIEGHSLLGVNVTGSSEVSLFGTHKVQNNGSLGGDPNFLSGVRVSRSSTTIGGGINIVHNVGPGVLADFKSGLEIDPDISVAGNGEGGVRLLHLSAGEITARSSTFLQSISCDDSSILFGDLGGIHTNCRNEESSSQATSPPGLRR